ncbi:aspartyl-tRNA synthetase [Raphidocelis subcapitata]|uniref:Aspartyl-tRNA synthetase n=1 Tax=Raphidocelis subcapitata TaxID=307507 RepID=A0A2V0P416_9CHLO|nr:aspartyl-tRNA synthetase [Raphidocelis subcapitata]|eukprot:GBF94596.1 aspartyl-tRNA synthetase [Raphidocelis subcapitata]
MASKVAEELESKLSLEGSESGSLAPSSTSGGGGGKKKDKKEKKDKPAAAAAAAAAPQPQRGVKAAAMTQPDPEDPLAHKYGDPPMVQSTERTGREWTRVEDLSPEMEGKTVLVRARIHTTRGKGKSAFLVLRQRTATVQAVLFADDTTVSRGMVKYACGIPKESIVDVEGVVALPQAPVESCSQKDVELAVTGIRAITRAGPLPFEVVDAARSEAEVAAAAARGESLATVSQDIRLDNRVVDLRTPANQAIFRVQSAVSQLSRNKWMNPKEAIEYGMIDKVLTTPTPKMPGSGRNAVNFRRAEAPGAQDIGV